MRHLGAAFVAMAVLAGPTEAFAAAMALVEFDPGTGEQALLGGGPALGWTDYDAPDTGFFLRFVLRGFPGESFSDGSARVTASYASLQGTRHRLVSFDLDANAPIRVQHGGGEILTITPDNLPGFQHVELNFSNDYLTEITYFLPSVGSTIRVDNLLVDSVPEPGTWTLLIAGFGLAGAALRRRPRAVCRF